MNEKEKVDRILEEMSILRLAAQNVLKDMEDVLSNDDEYDPFHVKEFVEAAKEDLMRAEFFRGSSEADLKELLVTWLK